jgi:hypothetical protein
VLDQARHHGSTLGADLDEFPADLAHYGRYHRRLRGLASRYPLPAPLSVDTWLEEADRLGRPDDGVHVEVALTA